MAIEVDIQTITNLENQSAVAAINANFAAIDTALQNAVARDGDDPNQMESDLDMNSQRILNLPAPTNNTEPLRLGDVESLVIDPDIIPHELPVGGVTNDILYKTSATDYAVGWTDSPTFDDPVLGDATATTISVPNIYGGGTTAAFPRLKRNGTAFDVRLGDDSAYSTVNVLTQANGTNNNTAASTEFVLNNISATGGGTVLSITPAHGLTSNVTASGAGSAITNSGELNVRSDVNAQTGTTYTILDADRGKLVTFSNTASVAVTLPQAGASSSFVAGWYCDIKNLNRGAVTITPTTSTINGATSLVLQRGNSIRLVSDGTNYQTGFSNHVVQQIFTSSGTYTPTTGMTYCLIECVGGGGGGGAGGVSTGGNSGGGGGGGGGYARLLATAATIGASQAVTIGAAGTGGAGGNNNGTGGGVTSVGTICIANGGSGGNYGTSGTQVGTGGAGANTTSTAGDFVAAGTGGNPGGYSTITTTYAPGGTGGSSRFGSGARGGSAAIGGSGSYGGGGGGGHGFNTASTFAGGNGGAGLVIITEYVNR